MKRGDFTGIKGIPTQDMAMWESMGPIADRSQDHPGSSDIAVVQFRRMMVAAAKRVARGRPGHRHDGAAHPAREARLLRGHRAEDGRLEIPRRSGRGRRGHREVAAFK